MWDLWMHRSCKKRIQGSQVDNKKKSFNGSKEIFIYF